MLHITHHFAAVGLRPFRMCSLRLFVELSLACFNNVSWKSIPVFCVLGHTIPSYTPDLTEMEKERGETKEEREEEDDRVNSASVQGSFRIPYSQPLM